MSSKEQLITQSQWSRDQGFSTPYVAQLVKAGVVELVDGLVDPVQANAALAARREPGRSLKRGNGGPELSTSALSKRLLKHRVKTEKGRAELLALKSKIAAGEYVRAEDVKHAAFDAGRLVRDSMLNIPDRLAATLAAESDAVKVHAALAAEIRQALEGLNATRQLPHPEFDEDEELEA